MLSQRAAMPARRPLVVTAAVKARSGKQVACSKTLIAKPEVKEAVAKLCADITSYSLEESKERASGIVEFNCMRDQWEDNVFHFWERYDSNASMGRHNTSPRLVTFMEKVHPHLQGPVAMALYEYKNGQLGPVCMSEGPKGEGGLDDATGASGAAGGASMKQTSASFDLKRIEANEEQEHQQQLGLGKLTEGFEAAKKQMSNLFGNMFGKAMTGGKK